jgi:hypothetical protein
MENDHSLSVTDELATDEIDQNALSEVPNDAHHDGELTLIEVCGQFEQLYNSRDENRFQHVNLNGNQEIFVIDPNFFNGTRGRKLFKRRKEDIPELYWYQTFGAYVSAKVKKFFITPCGFAGTDLILVAILETRCFNPIYEALVCNRSTNVVSILKKKSNWMAKYECDLTMTFDDSVIRR